AAGGADPVRRFRDRHDGRGSAGRDQGGRAGRRRRLHRFGGGPAGDPAGAERARLLHLRPRLGRGGASPDAGGGGGATSAGPRHAAGRGDGRAAGRAAVEGGLRPAVRRGRAEGHIGGRAMIGREARLFVCALQFLTRLPTPPLRDFQPEWIQQSARWFPLVGQVVGLIAAAILYGAAQGWSPWIAALLAVAAGVAMAGGFHEDGLADTADGLGGGQTR